MHMQQTLLLYYETALTFGGRGRVDGCVFYLQFHSMYAPQVFDTIIKKKINNAIYIGQIFQFIRLLNVLTFEVIRNNSQSSMETIMRGSFPFIDFSRPINFDPTMNNSGGIDSNTVMGRRPHLQF